MPDTLIVDPPFGHLYGFPRAVPDERRYDIIEWMVEQGYPRRIIDDWGDDHFPLRCWYESRAVLDGSG